MAMLRTVAIAAAVMSGAFVTPTAALACSVIVTRERSPAERQSIARRTIQQATAVIDGEVVRAFDKDKPALVYAYRTLKGPQQQWFQVGERDSCDVALLEVGQRLRLILVGGPETYFLPVDYSNAHFEDRILGSERRKDWPFRSGLTGK